MPTVLLARHGQASFGAADYDVLSPLGVRQAELLAAALRQRGVAPSRLVCGRLRRQRETALPFAAAAALEVDERWDEYDANEVLTHHAETELRLDGPDRPEEISGHTFLAVLEPAIQGWIEAGEHSPSARSWPLFAAAGASALDDLRAELGRGETALVCTSAGTIAALCAALLEAPGAFLPLSRTLVNTGVTKIVIGRAGASLVTINDHSHLEQAGRELITYR